VNEMPKRLVNPKRIKKSYRNQVKELWNIEGKNASSIAVQGVARRLENKPEDRNRIHAARQSKKIASSLVKISELSGAPSQQMFERRFNAHTADFERNRYVPRGQTKAIRRASEAAEWKAAHERQNEEKRRKKAGEN